MKKYKVKWDFCAIVEANDEEQAVEKAGEIWADANYACLIAKEIKECCGNCFYAEDGVCEFAGEISTDYLCEHYLER